MINKIIQKIQNSKTLLRAGLEICFYLVTRCILTCTFQNSTSKPSTTTKNSKNSTFMTSKDIILSTTSIKSSITWLIVGLEMCFNSVTRSILTCTFQESILEMCKTNIDCRTHLFYPKGAYTAIKQDVLL